MHCSGMLKTHTAFSSNPNTENLHKVMLQKFPCIREVAKDVPMNTNSYFYCVVVAVRKTSSQGSVMAALL